MNIPPTVNSQGMTRVIKFVHFNLWYMTNESRLNVPFYLIQHHTWLRSCSLQVRCQGLIQEDSDVLCPVLVQELDIPVTSVSGKH